MPCRLLLAATYDRSAVQSYVPVSMLIEPVSMLIEMMMLVMLVVVDGGGGEDDTIDRDGVTQCRSMQQLARFRYFDCPMSDSLSRR